MQSHDWRIKVLSGPNAGAEFGLAPGCYTIGMDASCDIVLADQGIGTETATLILDSTIAEVTAGAHGALRPNRRKFRRSAKLQIGTTSLHVARPLAVRPLIGRLALSTAAVVCMALILPSPLWGSAPAPAKSEDHEASTPAAVELVSVAFTADAASVSDTALKELSAKLEVQGLLSEIDLSATKGAILATGQVWQDRASQWLEIKQWFDGEYGGHLALIDQTVQAEVAPGPHVQVSAVRGGAVRYIITSSGDKLGEGTVVDGGWTILSITSDQIVFGRDGKTIEMRF